MTTKSGVGISQTTGLVWRDEPESRLLYLVEKWLLHHKGETWLHLPAGWTWTFKAKYLLLRGCCLEQASGRFMDVSTGWPRSIHDAKVLRLSTLYQRAEYNLILTEPVKRINGVTERPFWSVILLTPYYSGWLLYPHSCNLNQNQAKFKILSKHRVIVERAFGKLKCRWRCLPKPFEENTPKVQHTILTCCILHNTCVHEDIIN